jgi:hypothetical protein
MKILKKTLEMFLCIILILLVIFFALSFKDDPKNISYGVTFSKPYSDYLGLPSREVFISILDDLKVRKFRLVAYWSEVEKNKEEFNFTDVDFEIKEAQKRNAEIILAVGRRLPRWPECHIPEWAKNMSWDMQKEEILSYITEIVTRYRTIENIKYWQVENEPYLSVFAKENCGSDLDEDFLKEEIALVKKLDSTKQILITDSGNLGLWSGAWRVGDVFGTSVYMYLWNPTIGEIRSVYTPSFYKVKSNLMSLLYGPKKNLLIELSFEPWLIEPIVDVQIETQINRMDMSKFYEILHFAKKTGFDEQYLWGVEWWYFMKENGHPEYWDKAREIFSKN